MARANTSGQVNLRISEDLKARVRARAAENRRSVNSEIVVILERAMDGHASAQRSSPHQTEKADATA